MSETLLKAGGHAEDLRLVHSLVVEAIERLDRTSAPADIAAHLDLALHRLNATIAEA